MKVHWSNSADKETNFVGDVDNQSTTTEVKNFLIGPVLGKNGQPNGIIQFINKLDENGQVTEIVEKEDIPKFEDMKELIGMCIDNTSQISDTIGVTLKITEKMNLIKKYMNEEEDASKNEDGPNSGDLLEDIGTALGTVKSKYAEYCHAVEKRTKLQVQEYVPDKNK